MFVILHVSIKFPSISVTTKHINIPAIFCNTLSKLPQTTMLTFLSMKLTTVKKVSLIIMPVFHCLTCSVDTVYILYRVVAVAVSRNQMGVKGQQRGYI